MKKFKHTIDQDDPAVPPMGLIVLQVDETIEPEFRRYFADDPSPIFVTRIPSGEEATKDSLGAMESDLIAAAGLLPRARCYPVVGYGCTSASSIIGSERVETLIQQGCPTLHVTNPLRATVAWAETNGVSRFALLSPYIEEVNEPLRTAFARSGISTDAFGSFCEAQESRVARISGASIVDSAVDLGAASDVEAVFISCTNLKTFDPIRMIEARIGKPVLSSNRALAWHMKTLKNMALQ